MKLWSTVLQKLAEDYERFKAGKHGAGVRDIQICYEELLAAANCAEGERRELAERDLRAAQSAGVLTLERSHPRDPDIIAKVRIPVDQEAAFFAYVGLVAPTARREQWANLFREAAGWAVPERFSESWKTFCERRVGSALVWKGMPPFDRNKLEEGRKTLALVVSLLGWEDRAQVRWVSSLLCDHSKVLERRQSALESLLADATAGSAPTFVSLGILPTPPGVTFHGPLRLRIGDEWRDFRDLHGPVKLSGADIERVTAVECAATRCLTVENSAPFCSLAAGFSGELLIFTSYPNEATLGLLRRLKTLPVPLEFWHFGDTDPKGFDILADLRLRSGIDVNAFLMHFRPKQDAPALAERERVLVTNLLLKMPRERLELEAILAAGNKGDYEQEKLRPPTLAVWPFYEGGLVE